MSDSDYTSKSLKEILNRIESSNPPLYLPSIQRHFVWKPDRICKLFDSILSGYPIGTFLFWEVPDARRNEYAFYKFIQDFSEYSRHENDLAPKSLPPGITGVLDGQQRLNSMFVALKGSYEQFKGGRGRSKSSPNSYLKRHFYLNLLAEPDDEGHWNYDFDFLSDCELAWRAERYEEAWILVGDSLHWNEETDALAAWEEAKRGLRSDLQLSPEDNERAVATIKKLHAAVNKSDLITYYSVRDRELTEALEIFIRVNNGGITLNLMELYFSTVAAHWKEGRDEVEAFLKELRSDHTGLELSIEALMLACLCLSGAPTQLKVESFGPEQVKRIKDHWKDIKGWLRDGARFLSAWSFCGNNKVSVYAIVPLALASKAGYDLTASAEDLRQLTIRSLLAEFYSRSTTRRNRVLELTRRFMEADADTHRSFSLERFIQGVQLPSGISLTVSDETIEEMLETPIWQPRAFLLLSLLHGQHALHQHAFDKDHIHPRDGFGSLHLHNLTDAQKHWFQERRDLLPNLQLLQAGTNSAKKAELFEDWLAGFRPDEQARKRYLDENDIPADCSLKFADFEQFYTARRERLRARLEVLLRAGSNSVPVDVLAATPVPAAPVSALAPSP
jgi:hypothetical protein